MAQPAHRAAAADRRAHPPPPPPEGLVRRAALLRRLTDGAATLVLVRAPAGYGKTTLMAEWASHDARPFGWIDAAALVEPGDLVEALIGAAREVGAVRERP